MTIAAETKFGIWVQKTGVSTITERMKTLGPSCTITPAAVYQWVRGDHEPRPSKIRGLVKISDGELTFDDVNQHLEIARASKMARHNGVMK